MKRTIALVSAIYLTLGGVASAHGDRPHIRGTVVSVSETAITVKTKAGTNQTLSITPETKVLRGKTPATLQDVKPADRVVIHTMKHQDQLMASEIALPTPAAKKP